MTFHRNTIEALITTLNIALNSEQYADKALEATLANHPHFGLDDRQYLVTTFYDVIRHFRLLSHGVNVPSTELEKGELWLIWAGYLQLNDQLIPEWEEIEAFDAIDFTARVESASDAIKTSYPDWLFTRAEEELGDHWLHVAEALNTPAKQYLRVNTLKTDEQALQESLSEEGIETEVTNIGAEFNSLKVIKHGHLFRTSVFHKGHFEMQDAGSQLISPFLDVKPGLKVVDACAGAGGKSLHLATLMANKGRLLAMDVQAHKLDTLKKRAKRAGIHMIETREILNSKTIKRQKEKFDRVLLDVPCSGLGVLKRNPDAKWNLTEQNIDDLILLQKDILNRYSQMCKVGGKLVYATCSILPSENQQQVQAFLSEHPEWQLEEELSLLPGINSEFDGFYAARLVKTALKEEKKEA